MPVVKVVGIALAVLSAAPHLATYRPAFLRAIAIVLMAAPAIIMMPLVKLVTGSLVDSAASIWGAHSIWKMWLAGSLHVLYPVAVIGVAWLFTRQVLVREQGQFAEARQLSAPGIVDKVRVPIAAVGSIVAIPLLLFLVNSLFILIESITVGAKGAADLLAYAQEPGNQWALIHPTPAIHHTYAAAAYFYASTASTLLFTLAVPASQALTSCLRQEVIVRAISAFLAATGILLAVVG